MKTFKIIKIILVLILITVSCSDFNSGRKYYIAFFDFPDTFIPNKVDQVKITSILSNFYCSLVEYDPYMRIVPGLAASWANIDDTTWVFYLRKGVYFHDGKIFNANDVKFTIENIKSNRDYEKNIYLNTIKKIEILNDYEIKLITGGADPTLLGKFTNIYIINSSSKKNFSFNGTGSLIVEKIKNDAIIAKPFNKYWRGKVDVYQIIFKFYNNPQNVIDDYINRKIDLIAECNYPMLNKIDESKYEKLEGTESTLRYIGLNLRRYPFNNRYFRKAISFSIDREKMVKDIYQGLAVPANQFISPLLFGFNPKRKENLYNSDSAKYYMKKSGIKTPFKCKLLASPRRIDMINFIKEQLAPIGIEIIADTFSAKKLFKILDSFDFDIFLIASAPALDDGSDIINDMFYSHRKTNKGFHNRSGYNNREVDSLSDKLDNIMDKKIRNSIEWKIQDIILDDMPIIPLVFEKDFYFISDKVNFYPRADSKISIREIIFK